MKMHAGLLFKQNCDSGGWSGDLEVSDLTCQSLLLLILTSNCSMFFELKMLYLSCRINRDAQVFIELRYVKKAFRTFLFTKFFCETIVKTTLAIF